ncbi:hypothetical protein DCAR_0832899 [Daucus carota subsp. sativus]|uniref:Uncharacterized protein n=1 Tax=Daucus carota subsp. sativus TaxID=79200 RepID=A0AAF0XV49_DAUCS|nr:hypothetical protein DCAR_0832899 [Daucus carota subsp. sativus]
MVLKISRKIYCITCFSILFCLLFHKFHLTFNSDINSSTFVRYSPLSSRPLIRKTLATKFDFTPFLKNQHHHHHHHRKHRHRRYSPGLHVHSEPGAGSEIDPRYGVEKRLVPSGPNPLHH